jgi:hypothetical protein
MDAAGAAEVVSICPTLAIATVAVAFVGRRRGF